MIDGGTYTLKFVAAAYNDADGYGSYQTNYLLESYNLVGGSALSGDLNLQRLEQNRGGVGANLVDFNNVYKGRIHSVWKTLDSMMAIGPTICPASRKRPI